MKVCFSVGDIQILFILLGFFLFVSHGM